MRLEDYLEWLYRLGMAVGDFWFKSHDPLAYRLAERLFEVRREIERELERRETKSSTQQGGLAQ